jgi:excisionase family DNA binding protein
VIDVATETILTIPKAARRLGRDPGTVRDWVDAGELEAIQLGKRRYTSVEALQRMADRQTEENRVGRPVILPRSPAQVSKARQAAIEQLRKSGIAR